MQNNNTNTNTAAISRTARPCSNNSNTQHACAACKYQRRRCTSNCILAPYFPQDRQKQFINAHRLFGVGKITNTIKNMEPASRNIAMSTIMYQSDARELDPVGGCYRIIHDLQSQIEFHRHELSVILPQLAVFRAQFSQQMPPQNHYYEQPPQNQYYDFQEEISVWSDSIPLSPLTLQDSDNKEEPVEDDQKHVLDFMNSDKNPV